jgi:integrase
MRAVVGTARAILPAAHAALVAFVAGSGLRIDEARHTDADDVEIVDEERGYVIVAAKEDWQPKNYRMRRVPVSKATCDAALEFITKRGTVRIDDKTLWNALQKVRAELSLPKFAMHDLRRAWASALHANGASIKQVSVLLGHSGIEVTERYIRTYERDAKEGHQYLPL